MKHQRSHGVTGVTWFCEVPPSPTSLISIYPHPIRLVTPPPQPLPCIRRSSPTPVLSSDSSQFFPQTLPSSFLRLSPVLPSDSPQFFPQTLPSSFLRLSPVLSSDSPQFFPQALPITLDRGRYPHGGGADGEGAESPLPCLYFQYARIPHPAPVLSSDSSHYTGPWGVSPRGRGRRGGGRKPPPLSLLSICSHPPPRASSFLRLFPLHRTVGGIPTGEGQTGRGQKAPSPVSASSMPVSPTHTPVLPSDSSHYTGPWEVSPRGRGRRGGGRKPPPLSLLSICSHSPPLHQFFPQALPITLDRGRYRHGGGADGEGAESPLPCLCFQHAGIPHPHTSSSLRLFPLHWTVGGIPTGEGQTGRGQKPPPLSLLSICSHPPPLHQFFPQTLPITLDRGGYPHGGGADGEGAETPSPVSTFNMLTSPTPAPVLPSDSSHYTGPWGVSPRGRGRRGGGRKPPPLSLLSICSHPPPLHQFFPQTLPITLDRGGYPHGGGADGEGAESPLPCLCFQHAGIPHPCTSSFLRLFPLHRTVGGIATGEGQTGRGQKPSSPVSASNMLASPTPRQFFPQTLPITLGRGGYRHGDGADGAGAESPLPCLYFQYARIPHPCTSSFLRLFPLHRTVGGIATGEGQTGRGQKAPSPVSTFNMLTSPTPAPVLSSGSSHYTGPWGVSPRGRGRRGGGRNPPPCLCFQHAGISSPAPVLSSDSPHYTGPWEVSPRGSKND
jgi:hypothetical protein